MTRASSCAGITTHTRPVGGSALARVSPSRNVGTPRIDWSTRIQTIPQTMMAATAPKPRNQP